MTKIEELVEAVRRGGRRRAFGTWWLEDAREVAYKALEALPELREAAGSCVESEETMLVARAALNLVHAPGWEPSRPQEEELLSAVRRWRQRSWP